MIQELSVGTGSRTVVGLELIVAMLAVVAMNAMFVNGETSIELLRSSHVRLVATDDKRSRILQDAFERKHLLVAACFLGSQTMRAWLVLLSIPLAMNLSPTLASWLHMAEGWPTVLLSGFIVCIPVVAFNVMIGELVPRSYAASDPSKAVLRCYGFVRVFAFLFKPVAIGFMSVGGLLTRRFGASASFSVVNLVEEEIKERIEQAVETQEIEETEKEMLHSVFEFTDTVAREIMTPRVDMDAVPIEASLADVAKVVEESGHSRIPVFEGSDDQIVGIVHAKDVLSTLTKPTEGATLRSILRPAVFVPENKSLHDLLQEMRAAKTQLVIVQDEFGGTAGVVTIEDVVEEVVGEIIDEYDVEVPAIVQTEKGFTIEGRTHIDDVNDEIGTTLDSDEFDTLGGFVFGLFGRQPSEGEAVEHEGYRFTVVETDGRRISQVEVEKLEEPSAFDILDRITEGAGG